MKNKIYRIRNKTTKQFISLGYNQKSMWQVYPGAVLKENSRVLRPIENYEVVVFEYKEVETKEIKI